MFDETSHELVFNSEGNALDDFLPISARNSQKQMESWKKCVTIKTPGSSGRNSVSTYYQNDGSHLYLLTPNILPPAASSVQRWLFCDERGIYLNIYVFHSLSAICF
jgi:DNA polymerase zeta